MHNILAMVCDDTRAADGELLSEKCFYLQRNMQKLQQVGQLRVRAASITTQSGRTLKESSLSPSSVDGNSTTSTFFPTLERTESYETTSAAHDPFNVDLKQLSLRLSPSQYPSTVPQISLSDFLEKGGQLDFCTAIDFTSSNGKLWRICGMNLALRNA